MNESACRCKQTRDLIQFGLDEKFKLENPHQNRGFTLDSSSSRLPRLTMVDSACLSLNSIFVFAFKVVDGIVKPIFASRRSQIELAKLASNWLGIKGQTYKLNSNLSATKIIVIIIIMITIVAIIFVSHHILASRGFNRRNHNSHHDCVDDSQFVSLVDTFCVCGRKSQAEVD